MRATLQTVAQASGVSRSTASRILNGRQSQRYHPATCKRVMRAAQRVGYRPASAPRRLVLLCSTALGEDVLGGVEFFSQVIDGIQQEVRRFGCQLELASGLSDASQRQEYLRKLSGDGGADGLLLCGPIDPASFELVASRLPAVYFGDATAPAAGAVSCVMSDNVGGGLLATRHLLELGHRRILYLGAVRHPTLQYYHQRLAGYCQALVQAGIAIDPALLCDPYAQEVDSVAPLLHSALALPSPPTAIFAGSQPLAIRALEMLQSSGVCVPQDVSLISFDNTSISDYLQPALSAVNVPRVTLGRVAARRLLELIADPEAPPVTTLIPVNLVIRESTAAAVRTSRSLACVADNEVAQPGESRTH